MAGSEMRAIPNGYNDEAKKIDEAVLELVKRRRAIARGKRFFPQQETLEEWAEKFELEQDQVAQILHNLNDALPIRNIREELGMLTGVLPIMKRTVSEDCEYVLSHAMQYEHASIVNLEIKYLKENTSGVSLKPAINLVILGGEEYEIRRYGSHGGGGQAQLRFRVIPVLPENLDSLEFSLIPGSDDFFNHRIVEIKLDKQVDFY
jgi:hypothetical protein